MHEHRCKNPNPNICKLNLAVYERIVPHDQVGYIPGIQGCFTFRK